MDITAFHAYLDKERIIAGILFLAVSSLAIYLLVFILKKYVSRLVKHTKTEFDDILLDRMQHPLAIFLMLVSLKITLRIMLISERWLGYADKVLHSAMIFLAAHIAIIMIDLLLNHWVRGFAQKTRSKKDEDVLRLFHRFTAIVGYVLALLFVLQYFGVEVGPLFASLGIAGIAVAFALQDSLKNILGGVQLILDDVVRKGEVVRLEDGTWGTINNVGLRTTHIITVDNEDMIVPNGRLADQKIVNFFKPDEKIRIVIKFGVEYGSDLDKVSRVALSSIKPIKGILTDPAPTCDLMDFGDSALNFQLNFFVPNYKERWPMRMQAINNLYRALQKAKIGIPYPTRTLYIKK